MTNTELHESPTDVLKWWLEQMRDDYAIDMCKLVNEMTAKAEAALLAEVKA